MSRFRVSKVGDGFDEMKVRSVESRNSLHKWKGISLIDSEYGFDQGEVPCIESGDSPDEWKNSFVKSGDWRRSLSIQGPGRLEVNNFFGGLTKVDRQGAVMEVFWVRVKALCL